MSISIPQPWREEAVLSDNIRQCGNTTYSYWALEWCMVTCKILGQFTRVLYITEKLTQKVELKRSVSVPWMCQSKQLFLNERGHFYCELRPQHEHFFRLFIIVNQHSRSTHAVMHSRSRWCPSWPRCGRAQPTSTSRPIVSVRLSLSFKQLRSLPAFRNWAKHSS